ncbi:MAG: hypothetical protein SAJ12_01645 [Jaaginema sp. PMC 1079.18]|nr:hypothetical protein [Jaaginema sp. PMC 1080.18]MEC4849689.1 hypothetical protein [Jaaginema sp. PMC 1079.18]MEC4866172.1 hypothetical protein [Jaaginema sp. PMC 1078.18]
MSRPIEQCFGHPRSKSPIAIAKVVRYLVKLCCAPLAYPND